LNGAVSKTVVGPWSTEGSNPSPSALWSGSLAPQAGSRLCKAVGGSGPLRQETSISDPMCGRVESLRCSPDPFYAPRRLLVQMPVGCIAPGICGQAGRQTRSVA
jgi:hypothetical protein